MARVGGSWLLVVRADLRRLGQMLVGLASKWSMASSAQGPRRGRGVAASLAAPRDTHPPATGGPITLGAAHVPRRGRARTGCTRALHLAAHTGLAVGRPVPSD